MPLSSVPALPLPPCPAGCPEHAALQPAPLSQPWLADPRHPPAPAAITMVTLGSTVLCQACLFLSKTQPAWLAFPGAGSAPQPSFSTQEQSSSPKPSPIPAVQTLLCSTSGSASPSRLCLSPTRSLHRCSQVCQLLRDNTPRASGMLPLDQGCPQLSGPAAAQGSSHQLLERSFPLCLECVTSS